MKFLFHQCKCFAAPCVSSRSRRWERDHFEFHLFSDLKCSAFISFFFKCFLAPCVSSWSRRWEGFREVAHYTGGSLPSEHLLHCVTIVTPSYVMAHILYNNMGVTKRLGCLPCLFSQLLLSRNSTTNFQWIKYSPTFSFNPDCDPLKKATRIIWQKEAWKQWKSEHPLRWYYIRNNTFICKNIITALPMKQLAIAVETPWDF